jgi:hypothetical protein
MPRQIPLAPKDSLMRETRALRLAKKSYSYRWLQEKRPDGRLKCRVLKTRQTLPAGALGEHSGSTRGARGISCVRLAFSLEATYRLYYLLQHSKPTLQMCPL